MLPVLDRYMEYAEDAELSVIIQDSQKGLWYPHTHEEEETYSEHLGLPGLTALRALFQQSRRIRNLTLDVPLDISYCLSSAQLPDHTLRLPVLHSLKFVDEVLWEDLMAEQRLQVSAPILADLTIAEWTTQPLEYAVRGYFAELLPLHQLKSFKMAEVDNYTDLVAGILRHCTQLDKLDIGGTMNASRPFHVPLAHEVVLSNLRHLSLAYTGSGRHDIFFEMVRLPALETLSVRQANHMHFQWPTVGLLKMVRRSKAHLKHIDINLPNVILWDSEPNEGAAHGSMFELLRLSPDLHSFHVNLAHGDSLFSSLEKLADSGVRFPKLKDVMIRTIDITDRTDTVNHRSLARHQSLTCLCFSSSLVPLGLEIDGTC
ncbi:hypothetical protein VNI00_009115 [Paramarasmius palmivorus]|uniref:Uncharacterized protein n=1 Tax=Paramarasmius palmivorus TaxID=297713 RepID=A0AAW0CRI9_9AGAR